MTITPGNVLAAWKNLCPDQLFCPNVTRHDYPAPGSSQANNQVITLSYYSVEEDLTTRATTRLLVYPDRVEIPEWDTQIQPGGTFTQLTNGNWIAMRGVDETFVLDVSGKPLDSIDHSRFLLYGFDVVKGPVFEKNGVVYFVLNNPINGRFKVFSSSDSGASWRITNDSSFNIKSVDLREKDALYPNPFGSGFYMIGRNWDEITFNSPKIFNILISEQGKAEAIRVDDLQPISVMNTHLNSIAFDLNPDNQEHPILYAATNKGIFVSSDKGRSWEALPGLNEPVNSLAIVDDHQPKIIVASTENSGIQASKNGGQTWQPFGLGLLDSRVGSTSGPQLVPAAVYYIKGQLLVRTQGGWYRCADFNCEGKMTTIVPPLLEIGPLTLSVTEFYNSALDHYFITSDNDEISDIDAGQAGTGWSRTGFTFTAWPPLRLNAGKAVCRFYGSQSPGPNSHFFSASADECDSLHQLQKSTPADKPRWNFEGLPFMVAKGRVGSAEECSEGHIPIYRAYNNGYARGVDSNHRFVADHAEIDTLVAKGWADEGIAFCALP